MTEIVRRERAVRTAPRERILVVDADASRGRLLCDSLAGPDYDVLGPTDPRTAIDLAARHRPDLVVVWGTSPEEGVDPAALTALIQERLSAPLLFVTPGKNGAASPLCRLGSHLFFITPAAATDLEDAIRTTIDTHRSAPRLATLPLAAGLLDESLEREVIRSQKMGVLGQLALNVAHDLHNVLATIHASALLLQLDGKPETEARVTTIGDSIQRGVTLTRQLLSFARSRQRPPERLDLNDLVLASLTVCRRLLPNTVRLTVDANPRAGKVLADAHTVEQLLVALFLNARDALPHGGFITVGTGVRQPKDGTYATITVRDTGDGIPPNVGDRVFDAHFTTKGAGRGLGLTAARSIARRLGGDVTLDRSPDGGATFTILLPVADVPRASVPSRDSHVAPLSSPRGYETILLVDSDNGFRRMASRILNVSGYRVLAAPTFDAAADLAATAGTIHLLITELGDATNPGVELARTVLKGHPACAVLVTDAGDEDASQVDGFRVLRKPVPAAELFDVVRATLEPR